MITYLKRSKILIIEFFNNITWSVFSLNLKLFEPFLCCVKLLNKCQKSQKWGLVTDKPDDKEYPEICQGGRCY